jgi:hypothetical protein
MEKMSEIKTNSIASNIFYNAIYNFGTERGQSKYVWGIHQFDLAVNLKEQIVGLNPDIDLSQVFNFQITSFNRVDTDEQSAQGGKE